jgi:hypothetical protein
MRHRNGFKASGQRSLCHVDGAAEIFSTSVAKFGNFGYTFGTRIGTRMPSRMGGHPMRLSSSFAAPSAVAILSAALLCGPIGTAASQTATDSTAPLPTITVDAPKQGARPHRPEREANTVGSHRTVASRRASPTAQASSSISQVRPGPPGSILGKLAKLEKSSSSCNGGCETSFKTGNAPWVGCSFSTGGYATALPSPTCTDTLTYKSFADCWDTKLFVGWDRWRTTLFCRSLAIGGKFKVAELKGSRLPR